MVFDFQYGVFYADAGGVEVKWVGVLVLVKDNNEVFCLGADQALCMMGVPRGDGDLIRVEIKNLEVVLAEKMKMGIDTHKQTSVDMK